jgi:hypothetical protein
MTAMKRSGIMNLRVLAICAVLLAALHMAPAATRRWTGGSGNWNNTNKWSSATVPAAGDYVVITNAAAVVTLSNQTAWLQALLLSNSATLLFTNYVAGATVSLRATNVWVYGTIKQAVNTATSTNAAGQWPVNSRIYIVCSNFTLGTSGKINGNGCGFGAPSSAVDGYGPGGGKYNANRPGGGGYGGRGGSGGGGGAGGAPYGSATNPVQPGSGGGYQSGNLCGGGGGLLRIEARGRVTVNGGVTMNGNPGGGGGSGGSGGGVYISCSTVLGTGSIAANGGNGGGGDVNTGGGGGGRIAIRYDPVAQASVTPKPAIAFSANPSVASASAAAQPRPGSLYLSDASFFPYPVSLGCQIANPASTSCVLPSLTVTNDSLLIFPTGTVLQIAGNLLVSGKGGIELPYGSLSVGTNAVFGSAAAPFGSVIRLSPRGRVWVGKNLTLRTGPLSVYGNTTNLAVVSAGGNGVVTNGAKFYLYCGMTNAVSTNYAALVAVTGDLTVASSSWIYPASHATNGGSALFRMRNLTLLSGGGVNADGLGYGSPSVVAKGYGPGGGGYTANRGGGGGYGGVGGIAEAAAGTGGPTYGSSNAPVAPGSGGGSHGSGGNSGGAGGGLVRVEAGGTVTMAGSITANGTGTAAGGGGSGGGVYIRCRTTAGAGSISANGGPGLNNSGFIAGNGGGGRVALADWIQDTFSGVIAVNPGSGSGTAGKAGTVVRRLNSAYAIMTVKGSPAQRGTPSPYPYGNDGVLVGSVVTNTVNSPADEANGVRYACIGWTVTNRIDPLSVLRGGGTQAVFPATSNLVQTWLWTNVWCLSLSTGPNGYLAANPSGWYTNGVAVPVTAVASSGYYFVQWTGVGAPANATDASVSLLMDRVRTLQANFATLTPGSKTWNGTGNWTTPANWSPPGMPGREDAVTVSSGTATLSDSVRIGALRLINSAALIQTNASLVCSGNLTLTNTAKFYVRGGLAGGIPTNCGTWVTVEGDMTVSPNTWVYPTSHPTNGGSPFFRVGHLTILSGGGFDANGRGFLHRTGASVKGRGPGGGGAGGYRSGGGGYGGRGGCPSGVTGGGTYGSSNAPVHPGSAAGNHEFGDAGGDGGGLIHITAGGNVMLSGVLRANGTDGVGGSGGGSGGGIYLYCYRLRGAGSISANGGKGVNSDAGAGGGGRIAIWCLDHDAYSGAVTKIKGAQWYGEDGTLVWQSIAKSGTLFSVR